MNLLPNPAPATFGSQVLVSPNGRPIVLREFLFAYGKHFLETLSLDLCVGTLGQGFNGQCAVVLTGATGDTLDDLNGVYSYEEQDNDRPSYRMYLPDQRSFKIQYFNDPGGWVVGEGKRGFVFATRDHLSVRVTSS